MQCAQFTVEMFYQLDKLVWALWKCCINLYGLTLGLLHVRMFYQFVWAYARFTMDSPGDAHAHMYSALPLDLI